MHLVLHDMQSYCKEELCLLTYNAPISIVFNAILPTTTRILRATIRISRQLLLPNRLLCHVIHCVHKDPVIMRRRNHLATHMTNNIKARDEIHKILDSRAEYVAALTHTVSVRY